MVCRDTATILDVDRRRSGPLAKAVWPARMPSWQAIHIDKRT
jgi:hypothetical protein